MAPDNGTEGQSTLDDAAFSERFDQTLSEKLAPFSLEERRAYFIRLAAKLGFEADAFSSGSGAVSTAALPSASAPGSRTCLRSERNAVGFAALLQGLVLLAASWRLN